MPYYVFKQKATLNYTVYMVPGVQWWLEVNVIYILVYNPWLQICGKREKFGVFSMV